MKRAMFCALKKIECFEIQQHKIVLQYYGNIWNFFKNFAHIDWKIILFEVGRKKFGSIEKG